MKALVVFHDGLGERRHWLAWALKPGFRHVFCVILDRNYWIRLDGCMGRPEIEVVCGSDYPLARFYRDEGYTVIETEQGQKPVYAPLVHNNCVGLVKTGLCLKTFAVTPWQLYRHLERKEHATDPGIRRRAETAQGRAAGAATPAHADTGAG